MQRICCAFLLIFTFNSCKHSGIFEPIQAPQFKWTQYILDYEACEKLRYRIIWANSPKDIYVTGDITCSDYDLLHFDGKSWNSVKLNSRYLVFDVTNICGFNQNNVWICGGARDELNKSVNIVANFNGSTWENFLLPTPLRDFNYLYCIYGDQPDNIWAGGTYGTLYHYNGQIWARDTLIHPKPPDPADEYLYQIVSITGTASHGYYLKSIGPNGSGDITGYLFKYELNQWACIDSGDYIGDLHMSPEGTLYITGYGIRRWTGDHWTSIYPFDEAINALYVESDNQIFAAVNSTIRSTISYFNGKNWFEYKELTSNDIYYFDILRIDGELFVLGQRLVGKGVGVVWHGTPAF